MREEMIQIITDGSAVASGFLVSPDGEGPFPAVVVIQEWWGLNEHIKSIARRFVEEGFVALAPDLYHGKIVSEPNEAQKEAMALDRPRAVNEIIGSAKYLQGLPTVQPKQVGVTGFCMGGGLALAAVAENAEAGNFGAAVAWYGGGSPHAEAFADNKTPILSILGEKDERVTTTIRKLDADLNEQGAPFKHDIIVYPNAGHAFFNDTRPEVYDPIAAADGWKQAVGWFKTHLGGK